MIPIFNCLRKPCCSNFEPLSWEHAEQMGSNDALAPTLFWLFRGKRQCLSCNHLNPLYQLINTQRSFYLHVSNYSKFLVCVQMDSQYNSWTMRLGSGRFPRWLFCMQRGSSENIFFIAERQQINIGFVKKKKIPFRNLILHITCLKSPFIEQNKTP